jgi:hypothetical protein
MAVLTHTSTYIIQVSLLSLACVPWPHAGRALKEICRGTHVSALAILIHLVLAYACLAPWPAVKRSAPRVQPVAGHRWYNFYTVQIGNWSQDEHPDRPLLPLSTPQPPVRAHQSMSSLA